MFVVYILFITEDVGIICVVLVMVFSERILNVQSRMLIFLLDRYDLTQCKRTQLFLFLFR